MESTPEPYRETLSVPVSWWLLGGLFALAVFWAFLVAAPLLAAVVAGLVTCGLVAAGLGRYGAVTVATDPDGFCAGRALLPYGRLGPVEALDPEQTRLLLGVQADARAYLVLRAYCRTAVRVVVDDPDDPTPYWVVSTRNPQRLAASLRARAVRD